MGGTVQYKWNAKIQQGAGKWGEVVKKRVVGIDIGGRLGMKGEKRIIPEGNMYPPPPFDSPSAADIWDPRADPAAAPPWNTVVSSRYLYDLFLDKGEKDIY